MKKRFTEEQIIGVLQEAERGEQVKDVCRKCSLAGRLFLLDQMSFLYYF